MHASSDVQVLKHLTAKRPVSVDRAEFYVSAEAFASMVALEIVAIEVRGFAVHILFLSSGTNKVDLKRGLGSCWPWRENQ
jgi:hypothetical protein